MHGPIDICCCYYMSTCVYMCVCVCGVCVCWCVCMCALSVCIIYICRKLFSFDGTGNNAFVTMEGYVFIPLLHRKLGAWCCGWSTLCQWMVINSVWHTIGISILVKLKCRGAQFRKDFHRIQSLRALTHAPFMALTATATPAMETEIVKLLSLEQPVFIKQNLNRNSIFYSFQRKSSLNVRPKRSS